MSDLIKLLQDADVASLDLENARANVELAKQNLETSKEVYENARLQLDEVLGRAEQLGIAKAKVKKLIEERTQGLIASGLVSSESPLRAAAPKTPRAAKKVKPAAEESDEISISANLGAEPTDNVVNFN